MVVWSDNGRAQQSSAQPLDTICDLNFSMAWICRFFCDFCETQIQKLKIKEFGRQEKHSRKGIWHQKEWWLLCPQRRNLGESMWIEILPWGKCKCFDWTLTTIYHENYVHPDLSLLWSFNFFYELFIFSTSESGI